MRPEGGNAEPLYDRLGRSYSLTRHADERIAAAIWGALGDARTVLNVGAGSGAYEPTDREVVALEPSPVMIAQRPEGAATVIQGTAEQLPFGDGSFDAVMAILSDHHWRDRQQGFRELRRVARRRVVLFNANPGEADLFWLSNEYLPGFFELIPQRYRVRGAWQSELEEAFGAVTLNAIPIPHDCIDGFYGAYWRRPAAYLDPSVRNGISVFSRLSSDETARGLESLRADLSSGVWNERHRDLLELSELHLGYYVVLA